MRDMIVVGDECKRRNGELRRKKTRSESGWALYAPNVNGLISQLLSIAPDQQ